MRAASLRRGHHLDHHIDDSDQNYGKPYDREPEVEIAAVHSVASRISGQHNNKASGKTGNCPKGKSSTTRPLIVRKTRPDVGAAPPAHLADELVLDIAKSDVIGPAVGVGRARLLDV